MIEYLQTEEGTNFVPVNGLLKSVQRRMYPTAPQMARNSASPNHSRSLTNHPISNQAGMKNGQQHHHHHHQHFTSPASSKRSSNKSGHLSDRSHRKGSSGYHMSTPSLRSEPSWTPSRSSAGLLPPMAETRDDRKHKFENMGLPWTLGTNHSNAATNFTNSALTMLPESRSTSRLPSSRLSSEPSGSSLPLPKLHESRSASKLPYAQAVQYLEDPTSPLNSSPSYRNLAPAYALANPEAKRAMDKEMHCDHYGSQVTRDMLLEDWHHSFDKNHEGFQSMTLYIETRLSSGLALAAGWPSPCRVRTAVALNCLDLVLSQMTTYQSIMTTLRAELLNAIFVEFTPESTPPPETRLMPKWLTEARPYFETNEDDGGVKNIKRKVVRLEERINEEKLKCKEVEKAMKQWQKSLMRAFFYHWIDKAKFLGNKKKILSSFVARWTAKDLPIDAVFMAWWKIAMQSKFARNAQEKERYENEKKARQAELEYLNKRMDELSKELINTKGANTELFSDNELLRRRLEEFDLLSPPATIAASPSPVPTGSEVSRSPSAMSVNQTKANRKVRASVRASIVVIPHAASPNPPP